MHFAAVRRRNSPPSPARRPVTPIPAAARRSAPRCPRGTPLLSSLLASPGSPERRLTTARPCRPSARRGAGYTPRLAPAHPLRLEGMAASWRCSVADVSGTCGCRQPWAPAPPSARRSGLEALHAWSRPMRRRCHDAAARDAPCPSVSSACCSSASARSVLRPTSVPRPLAGSTCHGRRVGLRRRPVRRPARYAPTGRDGKPATLRRR